MDTYGESNVNVIGQENVEKVLLLSYSNQNKNITWEKVYTNVLIFIQTIMSQLCKHAIFLKPSLDY